jgi:hypothetical protein
MMKMLIAAVFVVGLSFAVSAPAQAMPVAQLGQQVKDSAVEEVRKACKRGYKLTPRGCRRQQWG